MAHAYFDIETDVLWTTIAREIRALVTQINTLRTKFGLIRVVVPHRFAKSRSNAAVYQGAGAGRGRQRPSTADQHVKPGTAGRCTRLSLSTAKAGFEPRPSGYETDESSLRPCALVGARGASNQVTAPFLPQPRVARLLPWASVGACWRDKYRDKARRSRGGRPGHPSAVEWDLSTCRAVVSIAERTSRCPRPSTRNEVRPAPRGGR